jgi:hypothetical protein
MSAIPLALPRTMLPSPEGTLSAGVTSQWVKVLPNNVSSVSSQETAITFTASTSTQVTLGATPIQFEIPTGNPNTFCDVAKSTISFRANYRVSTASSTNAKEVSAFLQSSAHSYFQRISTFVAGNMVDDVVGLDLAMAEETAYGYDVAARDANWNIGFLAENANATSQNNIQGHAITGWTLPATTAAAIAVGNDYWSYEIPLASSLLGKNAKSMCPVSKLGKTQVVLYTPQIAPVSIFANANAAGAGVKVTLTLDNFAINLFYVTLDDKSTALLGGMGGEYYMHAITHRVGTNTISSGTTGAVSVQVPIRVKSCRALSTRFSESDTANAEGTSLNGQYDAKMPLASTLNYFIGSQKRVPQTPHSLIYNPATVFSRSLMAGFGDAYEPWRARSGIAPNTYCRYLSTGTAVAVADGYDSRITAAGSTCLLNSLCNFSFCEDLRVTSTSTFLAGQDLTVSNTFLELNLAKANSKLTNVTFIGRCDVIYVLMPDGTVEYRV